MTDRLKKCLPALASACLALALYAATLGGTYVYDDFEIIFQDARVRDPSQWGRYWTQSYNGGVDNLFRPLVSMTYAVQWWLHGDQAWAFHLVNVLLHAGVSALVAELGRRLAGLRVGLLAGLLFAAHPIHVEAVANIVGRAELMCALGAVAAMVLFLHRPMTVPRALAIAGCFVLAVLSKEQGMLVPLLLLLLWICVYKEHGAYDPSQRRAWLILILLLCWGLAGYIVARESMLKFWWDRSFLDPTIQPMILSRGLDRLLLPISLLGRYAMLLTFPWTLSPDYGGLVFGATVRFDRPDFYVGVVALVMWITSAWISLRQRMQAALFCLLGLAVTYLVIGNIVTLIGTNFGERLMYLPSAFILLWVAILVEQAHPRPLVAIATVVLLAMSWRTVTYAHRWNDRLTLYETGVREQPNSIRLQMLLASELMSRGQFEEAEAVVARGRDLMPDYSEIWIQSGVIALEAGKLDEADAFLDRALQLRPSFKGAGWKDKVAQKRRAATMPG